MSRFMMGQYQMRFFGVGEKLQKMELTMRTPYKTLFKNFSGFEHVYIPTPEARYCVVNKGFPSVHLMPAGEIQVMNMQDGTGKMNKSPSGRFVHTGGWCFVHP